MKFSKHKLGELLRITRGASLPGTGYADEGRYLRLTLANFHEEGGFKKFKSTQGKYFVDSFDNRFLMHKGDLITPLTEQSPGLLGSVAFIPSDDLYIQSQDVGLITCNSEKLDKRFAYYLFLTKSVREQISARSQQTKIRHTSPDKIADVEVYLPDLPTQLRIAAILGSIDEKIELNRKKIAELEALAKTIYDYWFVQFDFPDKNGKPYKSSGGKMVWNEQLKREIPDGWEVTQIKTICKIRSGHPFQAKTFKSNGIYGIVTIKNVQDGIIDFPSEAFIDKYPDSIPSEFILKQGDILMSLTGYVGRVGLVTFSDCLLNQRVAIILPKLDIYRCYLYCLFRSELMKSKIENLSTGCAQKNVSPVDCENIFIPFNAKYVSHFQAVIESTTNEYINLSRQTQQLVNLRDTLLPLLMNGQVEVKE